MKRTKAGVRKAASANSGMFGSECRPQTGRSGPCRLPHPNPFPEEEAGSVLTPYAIALPPGRGQAACVLTALALLLLLAPTAQAQPADQCAPALHAAERNWNTPPGLLERIALVESGRLLPGGAVAWPWTIDVAGRGAYFDSKAAAIAAVQQAQAAGVRSIDVGCMQVNLAIHPGAFRSLDEAFDPAANADYAARYLSSLYRESGDWDVAAGLYHSHTPELAAEYRGRVAALGHGLLTGIGGPQPLWVRVLHQGRVRLAMAGGGSLLVDINRQPGRPGRRRATPCQVVAAFAPDMAPSLGRAPFRVTGCPGRR